MLRRVFRKLWNEGKSKQRIWEGLKNIGSKSFAKLKEMPVYLQRTLSLSLKELEKNPWTCGLCFSSSKLSPGPCHRYWAEFTLTGVACTSSPSRCCHSIFSFTPSHPSRGLNVRRKTVSVYYRERTVRQDPVLSHSGRNNKQIKRVNKWTSTSASPCSLSAACVPRSFQHTVSQHKPFYYFKRANCSFVRRHTNMVYNLHVCQHYNSFNCLTESLLSRYESAI